MDRDPRPPPKDAVRERYHAHHDHARSTLPDASWIAIQGIVLFGLGFGFESVSARWASVAGGALLVGAAIGLVRAAEWARLVAGLLLATVGVAGLVLPYVVAGEGAQLESDKATFFIVQFVTAVYLLLPSTRATFQRAREARERTRAARAGSKRARG